MMDSVLTIAGYLSCINTQQENINNQLENVQELIAKGAKRYSKDGRIKLLTELTHELMMQYNALGIRLSNIANTLNQLEDITPKPITHVFQHEREKYEFYTELMDEYHAIVTNKTPRLLNLRLPEIVEELKNVGIMDEMGGWYDREELTTDLQRKLYDYYTYK